MSKKTAICYLTCNKNVSKMEERYKKLPDQDYSTYIISDFKDNLKYSNSINHFEYSFNNYVKEPINIIYATFVSIYDLHKLEQYDYIWLLEDDVVFNGDFENFFNFYKNEEYDLICPHYTLNDKSSWWTLYSNLIRGNYKTKIPTAGGLGQIFRFSKKIIEIMIFLTEKGIYAHHEVFPFTVCNLENLTYHSIIDDNLLNKEYFDYNKRFHEKDLENIPSNLLVHSIKF